MVEEEELKDVLASDVEPVVVVRIRWVEEDVESEVSGGNIILDGRGRATIVERTEEVVVVEVKASRRGDISIN